MPLNGNTHPQEMDQEHQEVQHVGPRLTEVSIVKKKFRLEVSSVHFPHTGYGDQHVQQVFSELQKHTDRRRNTNTHVLIGGDFNAQVGSNDEQEATDDKYIGRRPLGKHNSRHQWLRHWAVQHQMTRDRWT